MHEEDDAEVRTILERVASYYGFVPRIYQELRHNPAALKTFFYKNEQLATDKALTGLAKELIAIGAATALGSEHCLSTHIKGAKRQGTVDVQIFVGYCLGHPLPKLRRCPNHFACGSANVWPTDHWDRIM